MDSDDNQLSVSLKNHSTPQSQGGKTVNPNFDRRTGLVHRFTCAKMNSAIELIRSSPCSDQVPVMQTPRTRRIPFILLVILTSLSGIAKYACTNRMPWTTGLCGFFIVLPTAVVQDPCVLIASDQFQMMGILLCQISRILWSEFVCLVVQQLPPL